MYNVNQVYLLSFIELQFHNLAVLYNFSVGLLHTTTSYSSNSSNPMQVPAALYLSQLDQKPQWHLVIWEVLLVAAEAVTRHRFWHRLRPLMELWDWLENHQENMRLLRNELVNRVHLLCRPKLRRSGLIFAMWIWGDFSSFYFIYFIFKFIVGLMHSSWWTVFLLFDLYVSILLNIFLHDCVFNRYIKFIQVEKCL